MLRLSSSHQSDNNNMQIAIHRFLSYNTCNYIYIYIYIIYITVVISTNKLAIFSLNTDISNYYISIDNTLIDRFDNYMDLGCILILFIFK